MIVPLFVGREKSVAALEEAMAADKQILLVAQMIAGQDDPDRDDIYTIGMVATVLQLLKLPDGTVRVLVEGGRRVKIVGYTGKAEFFDAMPSIDGRVDGRACANASRRRCMRRSSTVRELREAQQEAAGRSGRPARRDRGSLEARRRGRRRTSRSRSPTSRRCCELDPSRRLEMVFAFMEGETRRAAGREEDPQPRQAPDGEDAARILSQRAVEGDPARARQESEEGGDELAELGEDRKTRLSKEARTRRNARAEEAAGRWPDVGRSDGRAQLSRRAARLPWGKKSKLKKDIADAEAILDEDHYGLEKVKERIVEYLAVQARPTS